MRIVVDRFTRREYDLLPEGFPAQLIAGQLVRDAAPTYGHQRIEMQVLDLLRGITGVHRAVAAPTDVGIDDWNVFQPDVVVLREIPEDDVRDVGIPLLAVEVLSPTTARRDRGTKRRRMIDAGVAEVWIVDPVERVVEVHDAGGVRSARGEDVLRSNALPGFEVVPARLFERPRRLDGGGPISAPRSP